MWPLLQQFSSGGRMLSTEWLQQLSKAQWPFMKRMFLSTVPSNLACLLPLVDAPWSYLQSFSFVTVSNDISDQISVISGLSCQVA